MIKTVGGPCGGEQTRRKNWKGRTAPAGPRGLGRGEAQRNPWYSCPDDPRPGRGEGRATDIMVHLQLIYIWIRSSIGCDDRDMWG